MKVYNTMTRRRERFQARVPGKVSMFVCGPTVYNLLHVGHARTYTFFDVVARYLSHLGYQVEFQMNITDVDERITRAAQDTGTDPTSLAKNYAKAFLEDMTRLKILTVKKYHEVSRYIDEMIHQISLLIEKRHAYIADGEVYFDTSTYPGYGKLSHQTRQELLMKPIELSLRKRNLVDFALWGPVMLLDGKWDSPWGMGSPGWHIQDTAITLTNLGPQYDIHGGAYDLVYPHHEAEIAEAESLTSLKPLVRYWVHTGLVNIRGSKMSKSAGNIYPVRDLLGKLGPNAVRLYLLSHHYRKDLEFEDKQAKKIAGAYSAMKEKVRLIEDKPRIGRGNHLTDRLLKSFYAAVNNDFDTPRAIIAMRKLINEGSRTRDPKIVESYYNALRTMSEILGVDLFEKPQREIR